MAGKPHLIKIRKREQPASGKPAFVTSPGKEHVRKSDQIVFLPQGTNAVIFIPNADILLDTGESTLVLAASAGHQTKAFSIAETVESGKEFPYAVYCVDDNDFAEGGSTPRFIID